RDHPFARLKSVRNNPLAVDTITDLDRSDAHFVLVVHRRDLIAALQLRHSTLRHKQGILLESHSRANLAVPAWTQNISRIRKKPGDPNCARTLIYLAVRKVERALVRIARAIRQNQFEAQIPFSRQSTSLSRKAFSPCQVLGLADGEIHLDGV